jgi:TolB-like protein/Tfp pilus assembly protein PilF
MRAEDGRIVLMDFGTGREFADDASSDLAGTPLYLAPEVLDGQQATVQSDIYSLGVLLYHLVTGSYPVHARTVREVRRAHERGKRTAVRSARRDVRPKLARIIERAIAPRPEQRYESADALGADLAALKPRRKAARVAYAAAWLAAFILVVLVGWEVAGRQRGFPKPSALLMGFVGLNDVASASISPVERPVIAVLPFKNLSAQRDTEYFVDGLTDEIIRNLAVVQGLEVRSHTSSFEFKDKPRNLQQLAEQLGANLIVEGSVQRDGNRLRISAQLVQVEGDTPLWSDRFDRELKDIFAIQDEISRAIVNKLRLTLGTGQRRYYTNLEAYELYLKARELVDRRSALPAQQAIKLFEQAIARDPSFAPAYAGLADAYAAASEQVPGPFGSAAVILPETALELIAPAAETALQLDPMLAEAHAALGLLYARKLDWQKAEASFRRAIDLNPGLTRIYTTYSMSTLVPLGKLAEAEQLQRRALQSDPLSLAVQRELAWLQFITGRYEEAVDSFERIRAIDPHFPYVDIPLARALTFAGRPAEALHVLEPNKEKLGHQHWMAHAYVLVGQRAAVERLAATHDHPFRLAVIYAALGDTDRAFEALEQAVVRVPHRVAVDLLREPEMAALRGDQRFDAIRRKLGLP